MVKKNLEFERLKEDLLFLASQLLKPHKVTYASNRESSQYVIESSKGNFLLGLAVEGEITGMEKRVLDILVKNAKQLFKQNVLITQNQTRFKSQVELANSIAHEINNPLSVIMGHCYYLHRQIQNDQLDKALMFRSVEKISLSTSRLEHIIQSMKRLSGAPDDEQLEILSVTKILQDCVTLFDEKVSEHKVDFELIAPMDVLWSGHAIQLSQVIFNLVNNALQAIEPLEKKWIRVELPLPSDLELCISVTDSGLGISKDISKNMMKPFYTTKTPDKGSGLGLSICRDIVDSYGGSLDLDATCEHTRFLILLPLGGQK